MGVVIGCLAPVVLAVATLCVDGVWMTGLMEPVLERVLVPEELHR